MNFKSFLCFVKVKWRMFYYFTLFFIIMTLISGFIVGQSITPFYVYQMYSQSLKPQKNYSSFEIEVNGEYLDLYKLRKERADIIYYNFDRYISLKSNGGHDKYFYKLKELDRYKVIPDFVYNKILTIDVSDENRNKLWLHNLLAFSYKEKINTLRIYETLYSFDYKNNVKLLNKTEIDYFVYD